MDDRNHDKQDNFRFKHLVFAALILLTVASILMDERMITSTTTKRTHTVAANPTRVRSIDEYTPASNERFVMDYLDELGYGKDISIGCNIYPFITGETNNSHTDFARSLHMNLEAYDKYLEVYKNEVKEFKPIPDLMKSIYYENDNINTVNHDVCESVKLHPGGLHELFSNGTDNKAFLPTKNKMEHGFLSHTSKSGFVEPLLPPMRSHKICDQNNFKERLMDLDYLVHDFEHMCRRLKPNSRRIFIDMGAAFDYHKKNTTVPVVQLLDLYEKFGFQFDHIYGFEIDFKEPNKVFRKQLPEKLLSSYHWINVGITYEEGHRLNPLHSVLSKFTKDDFIVVKLDVDTPSVEVPLAHQLLKNSTYHHIIDHFYFEHHVNLQELAKNWKSSMHGTVKDSLELFHSLRKKGIPAHFWP